MRLQIGFRRFFLHYRWVIGIFLGILVSLLVATAGQANSSTPEPLLLTVYNHELGASTRYIGACEGNVGFASADFEDLAINTYRVYGGMSRWESEDDDGAYGYPAIAQIKENPDLINWDWWDQVMTYPEGGSDYHFSGPAEELWQGSARTIFETLKAEQIRPVVTLRNSDPGWEPDWALQLNPPRTPADWNEWWEHVFATVYWLNVRNDYHVDDWEIHNEPDNRQQGWGGNQADYFELMRVAEDAIAHVYNTYLPDRIYQIHAPKTLGGSDWPEDAVEEASASFNSVNVHNYDQDVAPYIQQVRRWMQTSPQAHAPLWIGEWGTYTTGYDNLGFSLNLLKNMIRMAQPGASYVDGSHLFSLYDWGQEGAFEGLIDAEGDRRLSYYTFRMGIRALQGGKPVLLMSSSKDEILAIATQDEQNHLLVLVVNDQAAPYGVSIDVSRVLQEGTATVWEFSDRVQDEVVGAIAAHAGDVSLLLPGETSFLLVMDADQT